MAARNRLVPIYQKPHSNRPSRNSEDRRSDLPDLHREDMVRVEFWVPRSLGEVIERCIEKTKVLNETESRTAAIEAIFAEYDVRHADPEKERKAERQEVS
jgi:hypothetical protein